jgi:4-coumarate--CoA ligase
MLPPEGDPRQGPTLGAKKSSFRFILPNLEVEFINPDTSRSLPKNM